MKKQRRDLLKASVPVIATICSGSAYAASSSHCAIAAAQQSPQPKAASASVDEWLRQTVTVYKKVPGANGKPALGEISDGGYFLGSDNYWYKIAFTELIPKKITSADRFTNPVSGGKPYDPPKTVNVLYYVDKTFYTKTVYGPATAPNGTQSIPGSCWMSVI